MKAKSEKEKPIPEKLFSSEVKIELLMLFRGNPGITDTIEGVARRIGRVGHEVERDLEDFVDQGILTKKTLGNGTRLFHLHLSGDKKALNSLDQYFKSLGDRELPS